MNRPDTADYCPTCNQPRERNTAPVERYGLRLHHGELSYNGKSVHIGPAPAEFLGILMERGSASREFLILRCCPEAESKVVDVYAYQLRRTLRDLTDGRVAIRTVYGWGFVLADEASLAVAA